MDKAYNRIFVVITFFTLLILAITGCSQQEKLQSDIDKESVQDTTAPDYSRKDQLTGSSEKEALSGITNVEPIINRGTNGSGSSEQTMESSEVQFSFYPSGPDFIKNIIDKRGQVEITETLREQFNQFARDYRLGYLPDMNYYESFFEANQYAQSFGYTNFGFAVFYVLKYMRNPEKMSNAAMQQAIQTLFVAKNGYKNMPHQAYRKLANYTDGYYSPWPEGEPDPNRRFYLLTGLKVIPDSSKGFDIKIQAQSYYFNDSFYQPGEKEKWLAEKSKEMGVPDLRAADKLISSGKMSDLQADNKFETTIYIDLSQQNQNDYNPQFISNHKSLNQ